MNQPDPTETARRERYAKAIRDRVRFRFGASVLALAQQGRPLKMNFGEAETAADAAIALADAEHKELRTQNARMRHELEVMYGGAFDTPPVAPVVPPAPTSRAALSDEIERLRVELRVAREGWLHSQTLTEHYRKAAEGNARALGSSWDENAELRRLAADEQPDNETPDEARQSCACGQDGCEHCDTDEEPLLCPRCGDDISDYGEDDFVFRTGDDRPYCSGECVVAAHRAALKAAPPAVVPQPEEADRVVAHVLAVRTDLHCLVCAPPPWGDIWTPVTAGELEDGGICPVCGVDVLIPHTGEQPS